MHDKKEESMDLALLLCLKNKPIVTNLKDNDSIVTTINAARLYGHAQLFAECSDLGVHRRRVESVEATLRLMAVTKGEFQVKVISLGESTARIDVYCKK